MTETSNQNDPLIGRNVVDNGGSKIGTVADVYVDDQTGQPAWLAVTTGLFGTKVSFVPLQDAELYGDDVVVAYDKSLVKDAPRAEADGHLSPEDEAALYAHYSQSLTGEVDVASSDAERSQRGSDVHATTGADSDMAMTRSEEELDVTTRSQEAGRVRLRKWV
ncbi:MAG: PRC-barrel domain-containing protein, partial [Acidimicrobiia bacterium]|nr:PRC-barrel domain-containing protein [Acidimicrobiia bacterium]